jgi:RHS repeat-associated protein
VTKLPTNSDDDTVSWNYDNKLKAAQKGTSSITVKYDPMGNRVFRQSTVGGVTTGRKYIVDISGELPTILCEIDDPNSFTFGSLKTSYVYADGQILSQRIHTDPNNSDVFTPYYYVHDRLGSVRLMIDETGTAVNSYCYKPYGSFYESEVVEAVDNPWKFTGQYYDAEIEQYYLRARQYDPAMMRFTSRDMIKGKRDYPLSLHKYLYCGNEPLSRIDPTGNSMASILVEPIMAGYGLHGFATMVTAIGVETENWNIMKLGIELEKTILPTMGIIMMTHGMKAPKGYDTSYGLKESYSDNYFPGPASSSFYNNLGKAGKWVAIGFGLVALSAHIHGCLDTLQGINDFNGYLNEEPEFRSDPNPPSGSGG